MLIEKACIGAKEEYDFFKNEIKNIFELKDVKIEELVTEEKTWARYNAFIYHKEGELDFFVEIENRNPTEIVVMINYQNEFGLSLNYSTRGDKLENYRKGHISKWIESIKDEIEIKKEKDKLGFFFGDRDFKVQGDPRSSIKSAIAFEMALNGYAKTNPEKILIYKIKHYEYDGTYRVYSYAIFFDFRYDFYNYSYWAIFPAYCSPDSGTASSALDMTNIAIKKINNNIPIIEREFTTTYDNLKKGFLKDEKRFLDSIEEFRIEEEHIIDTKDKIDEIYKDIKEIKDKIPAVEKAIRNNPDNVIKMLESYCGISKDEKKSKITNILTGVEKITDKSQKIEYLISKARSIVSLISLFL